MNVLLHGLAIRLGPPLRLRVSSSELASGVGAAVLAVHAIHSVVVAGVVGPAEVLDFVFGPGAILLLLRSPSAAGAVPR